VFQQCDVPKKITVGRSPAIVPSPASSATIGKLLLESSANERSGASFKADAACAGGIQNEPRAIAVAMPTIARKRCVRVVIVMAEHCTVLAGSVFFSRPFHQRTIPAARDFTNPPRPGLSTLEYQHD